LTRLSHLNKAVEAVSEIQNSNAILESAKSGARYELVAASFVSSLAQGRKAIVVAGADAEEAAITHAIRAKLRTPVEPNVSLQLTGPDVSVVTLARLTLDPSRRKQGSSYQVGQTIEFDQNVPGIPKGRQFDVVSIDQGTVWIGRRGQQSPLNLEWADKFTVYEQRPVKMTVGDTVIATRSRMAHLGGRLVANSTYKVTKISPEGQLELDNAITFPAGNAHIRLGYAVNAATETDLPKVDDVHVALSVRSMRNLNGWPSFSKFMVSAKETISVYTDNAELFSKMLVDTAPTVTAPPPKPGIFRSLAPAQIDEPIDAIPIGDHAPKRPRRYNEDRRHPPRPLSTPDPAKRPPVLEH
jgi:hypothetical protein